MAVLGFYRFGTGRDIGGQVTILQDSVISPFHRSGVDGIKTFYLSYFPLHIQSPVSARAACMVAHTIIKKDNQIGNSQYN